MSNITITQLPTAGALTGTEAVPVVQNGVTVQTTTGAIQATSNLTTYPFLMTQATSALGSSRYVATGSGLSTADGGAGSTFTINLTGAPLSLVTSGTGIQVKTNSTTLVNRTITITGSGLAITNGDGISGNPTISTTGVLANFASTSGTGLVTINGTTVSQTTITGTSGQITVTNGNASGGNPTIAIADNPVLTGTAGLQLPTGNTSQRSNVNGLIRYNSQTTRFEGYEGGNWSNLGTGDGTVTSVTGTANQITVANSTTTPVVSIVSNPIIPGVASITLPAGGTSARPSGPTNGMLRYNSDLGVFEGYANSVWGAITTGSGVTSVATGIGLTGGPITSTGTISIANTTVTSGSYGSATQVGTFTVNAQGQLTSASNVTVTPAWSSITSTPTTLSGYGITDGVSLTGTQTLTNKTISGSSNTLTNIGNSSLTNSSITLGTTAIALGGTSLTPAGLTSVTVTQDPTTALQLATKQYVDSVAQGLNTKAPVLCATTTNITLSGEQTIDGVTTSASRVLVKNQSTASQNGIYLSGSGAWTRTTDANTWNQLISAYVFVETGSTQADTGWVCTVDPGGTIGVTAVTWVQFSGAGTYTAGTGLTLTGTQFSITNTAVTAGAYGSATQVGTFSVNAQGQLTLAGNTTVTPAVGSITGLGTGVATALAINTGSSGAFVVNGGALGTPSSGTVTNLTGTASININGTVGATTATTGAFTTVSATGVITSTVATGTAPFTVASTTQVANLNSATSGTATNATNVALTAGSGATNYLHFSASATGNQPVNTNTSLTYNYTNNAITSGINGGTF